MAEDPVKWTRGRGQYVITTKCTNGPRLWVRSSYEAAAVRILEDDVAVLSYTYEQSFVMPDGRTVRPDFFVVRAGGLEELVEVKASWVFGLSSDHKVSRRLDLALQIASEHGWAFRIWTEKEALRDALD